MAAARRCRLTSAAENCAAAVQRDCETMSHGIETGYQTCSIWQMMPNNQ
jgi:hypothetical protein